MNADYGASNDDVNSEASEVSYANSLSDNNSDSAGGGQNLLKSMWARVLAGLEQTNMPLYAVCSEIDINDLSLSDDTVVVMCEEIAYNLLRRSGAAFDVPGIKVQFRPKEKRTNMNEALIKLKELFGDILEIK